MAINPAELEARLQQYLHQVGLNYEIPQDIALIELQRINAEPQDTRNKIVVRRTLSLDGPAMIIPLYDVHFGHNKSNLRKLMAIATLILKTKDCYTFIGGDLSETATRTSIGKGMFDEVAHIREQLKFMKTMLKPLADAGKVLCAVSGNHEHRVSNLLGIDPLEILCDNLKIPYCEYQGYMLLTVGNQVYEVFCHHGVSGGRTVGAKMNAAMKFNQVAVADLYISGHTHMKESCYDKIFIFDRETGELREKIRHYVIASSFLEYFGCYTEMQALVPAVTGATAIQLMDTTKEIRITK